jgi:hypothetical protein
MPDGVRGRGAEAHFDQPGGKRGWLWPSVLIEALCRRNLFPPVEVGREPWVRSSSRALVIAIATSIMRIVAFTLPRSELPRCVTRHKLGIQTYKCRAGRQIAMLFERAAWSEHTLGKAAAVARIY